MSEQVEDSYRYSHIGRGADYHEKFESIPHRKMLWDFEKQSLLRIVQSIPPTKEHIRYLDFACGTGRVCTFLENHVDESYAVDVSESMMAVAKGNASKTAFFQVDLTNESVPELGNFDLITAFRFFPNAEQALRDEAIKSLVPLLSPSGLLVFNNHKNERSLQARLRKFVKPKQEYYGLSDSFIREFVDSAGLKVVKTFHAGVLPISENRKILPRAIMVPVEKILGRFSMLKHLAQDVIYVCARKTE